MLSKSSDLKDNFNMALKNLKIYDISIIYYLHNQNAGYYLKLGVPLWFAVNNVY